MQQIREKLFKMFAFFTKFQVNLFCGIKNARFAGKKKQFFAYFFAKFFQRTELNAKKEIFPFLRKP